MADFSPKQLDLILDSTARINVAEGAVRSGKSFALDVRWLEYTQTQRGPFLLTGKTIDTVRRNIIQPLTEIAGPAVQWLNQGRGELLLGKAVVHVVGANDAKSESRIRGITAGGWYADEVTLHPQSFVQMALSRLSIPGAKAFWSCNPDNPRHFIKTDYIDNPDLAGILKRWHFNLDDNPALDAEYKDSLCKLYTGLFYQRFIEGLWVLAEGVVYDGFQEAKHVTTDLPQFQAYFVAVDYGTANPCVFLLFGVDAQGGLWIVKEYYWDSVKRQRQKTDAEYADDFGRWLDGKVPMGIFCDPSAASFIKELRQRGWVVLEAENAVLDGIRTVSSFLANGKLHVHPSCTNLREEVVAYVWDAKAQERGEDKPLKQNDHAMDAMRYGVATWARRSGVGVSAKPAGW